MLLLLLKGENLFISLLILIDENAYYQIIHKIIEFIIYSIIQTCIINIGMSNSSATVILLNKF